MYANKTVGAVIPAYNEEGFIGRVIETLPTFIDRAYVIDDGSTDGTWDEILEHVGSVEPDGGMVLQTIPDSPSSDGDTRPTIVPIRHPSNRGVGGAIKTGYRHAQRDRMDVTTVIAGDGQTEPDIVERIVKPVAFGRVDYSKGNRMITREGMPPFRQLGNHVLALLTKIASGYWRVNDPQNGSTAISLEALESIDYESLYDEYGFVNDLLIRLNAHDMRVADVPRRAVYKDETSHIKYSHFIVHVSTLLLTGFLWRLRVKYLERDVHPLVICYFVGAGAAGIGLVAMIWNARSTNLVDVGNGAAVFVLGWALIFLGMVWDRKENEHLQETAGQV